MMRIAIEYAGIRRLPDGPVLEAKCKAASCRASPRTWSGNPETVLSDVSDHVRRHLKEYIEVQEWIAGERVGVRVVR